MSHAMCASLLSLLSAVVALLPLSDEPVAPQLVPQPVSLSVSAGRFDLTGATIIATQASHKGAREVGQLLADALAHGLGRAPGLTPAKGRDAARDTILLTTVGADPELGDEGYTLDVSSSSVVIRARTGEGLFRGTQTLRQLLPTGFEAAAAAGAPLSQVALPLVTISDQPRYPWRGLLLDCGREFMSVEFIKRTIDLLAYHRMNVLHWHLVEDQGWRLEIEGYPLLTEVGSWRGEGEQRSGGFYSQDEVREIVAYAAERYVTVVPEIELPGHCVAALASYPELGCRDASGEMPEPLEVSTRWGVHADVYCAGKETTFEFLTGVLTETLEMFPSEFIHIGGDEVPKTRWQDCADCQQRMVDEGLADEDELQSWFVSRIGRWLAERGRRLVGWDEILEGGLAEGATVQSWRGMSGALEAARMGHDVISSPTSHCYLDYSHENISLEKIYSFEPTPPELSEEEAAHVLGAEGNMWTEHAPQERVDTMVWPRLCALAEVTWSPAGQRSYYDFYGRMRSHSQRLDALGVRYYVAPPTVSPDDQVFLDSLEIRFGNPSGAGVVRYTLDDTEPTTDSLLFDDHPLLWRDTVVQAAVFLDNGRRGEVGRWVFDKQEPLAGTTLTETSAGLHYRAYHGRWSALPDFGGLEAAASGLTPELDLTLAGQDDGFALEFEGFLDVPTDGLWTLHLSSDDGSRLWLGGDLLIDHDGLHGATTRFGQRLLQAGLHKLRLAMFESGGAQQLSLLWSGPGQSEPVPVPAARFRVQTSP